MWFKVDEEALDDWRIQMLAARMSTTYGEALLLCLRVWRVLYQTGGLPMPRDQVDSAAKRQGFGELMMDCKLAVEVPEGLRICGDERAKGLASFRMKQKVKIEKRWRDCNDGDTTYTAVLPGNYPGNTKSIPHNSDSDSSSVRTPEALELGLGDAVVPSPIRAQAEKLWALQSQLRAETCPGSRPLKFGEAQVERVLERLCENSYEDCEHVLRVYAAEARRDPKSRDWFNGETNWRRANFERALGKTLATEPAKLDPVHISELDDWGAR